MKSWRILKEQNDKTQSKIEKLIVELCPNGVEFKELGELGEFYGGLTGKSKDDFQMVTPNLLPT